MHQILLINCGTLGLGELRIGRKLTTASALDSLAVLPIGKNLERTVIIQVTTVQKFNILGKRKRITEQ